MCGLGVPTASFPPDGYWKEFGSKLWDGEGALEEGSKDGKSLTWGKSLTSLNLSLIKCREEGRLNKLLTTRSDNS